ncbi:MAG TPA: redox-regulated ATPase YchF [Thermoplasmata archaeon]|nr:redox-regulated ATPase YchF [Thermoplasmata archaeon]
MEIGVVGKPNVGKSTFFSACTLAKAEIAAYPFTTIDANRGVGYVRSRCPCGDLGVTCSPKNSRCEDGTRLIPVELIDVAGLVPDAHQGRGLGNRFLDDLRAADALIHIIDASGATDLEGNPGNPGEHDPLDEIGFLRDEIALWIRDIIKRDWHRMSRQIDLEGLKTERALAERLSGLKVDEHDVHAALRGLDLPEKRSGWTDDDLLALAREIRRSSKPIVIVANKADIAPPENLERLRALDEAVVVVSAEYELALHRADAAGLIRYLPGSGSFEVLRPDDLNERQRRALERIRAYLDEHGSTGVVEAIEHVVFDILDRIVVYPVEDEHRYTDKDGNVLPDAYLMPVGTTARDLAYRVHTEIGDGFIRAINARTGRVLGADHVLEEGDVIKIVAHR